MFCLRATVLYLIYIEDYKKNNKNDIPKIMLRAIFSK